MGLNTLRILLQHSIFYYLLLMPQKHSPLTTPTEESLLVLRTLGIQTTTLSSSYLLPATTRFIPTSQIRDMFIHEAFRGFEVRFYLCVVVEGEGEAVVVFPVSLTRISSFSPKWLFCDFGWLWHSGVLNVLPASRIWLVAEKIG